MISAVDAGPRAPTPKHAALALGGALAAGCLTQTLFWDTSLGLGWLVLDALLVGAMLFVFGRVRGRVPTAAAAVAAGAVSLGAAPVYYASDWSLALALPASLLLLAVLPILLTRPIAFDEGGALRRALLDVLRQTPRAAVRAAELPRALIAANERRGVQSVLRGLLVGLPIAGGFALLLSADSAFAAALGLAASASTGAARFVAMSVLSAIGFLFVHALHAGQPRPPASPSRLFPYRVPGDAPSLVPSAPVAREPFVRPVTWGIVLAQVVLVFGVFAAANLRYLFAGHALARARGTVTYAEYLHAGFAQLSAATVLAVVTVVVGHRLLCPRGAVGGKVPGGAWLASLEVALLALSGVALASCWQRLCIYEVAYGYTYLRLAVELVQLGVFALLFATAAKSVVRGWRGWGAASLLVAFAMIVVAPWINADAYVARGNVERAAAARANAGDPYAWGELDVDYLASLSADASAILSHPLVQGDPELAARIRRGWQAGRDARHGGWRALRGLGSRH